MSKSQVLRLLEQHLCLPPESLTGAEFLPDVGNWDSMALLGFIVLVDRKLKVRLKASQVTACQTVDQLLHAVCSAPARAA